MHSASSVAVGAPRQRTAVGLDWHRPRSYRRSAYPLPQHQPAHRQGHRQLINAADWFKLLKSGVLERASFGTPGAAFVALLMVVWLAVFAPYAASYFFLFDDYAQLDFVSSHSYADILVTPEYGNFRPGAYLFWKTWLVLFGAGKPSAFALFNLLAHSLNAILLGMVLRRFRAPAVLAWSAAAVFLVFPPANEALFWVSGGHYTYGLTFLLLAVLSASLGLNSERRGTLAAMGALSFSGTLAAMLTKETAYIAFPLVASLAWLNRDDRQRLSRRVWLVWFLAFNAAVPAFFLLRGQVIPLSQSGYGDSWAFYAEANLVANFFENVRALFTFGYFGSSSWVAEVCGIAGWFAAACLSVGFIDKRRRPGSLSFAVTLVLALGATTFVAIGPGAAVAGRLLYMPGMIASIMIGAGLSSLLDIVRRTSRGDLRLAATLASLPAAALIAVEFASLQSFAWRFGESTSLARNVMAQIAPLRNEPFVHVRNLPHLLANGPYVLKCYALAMYLGRTEGRSPRFRCDRVFLDYIREGYAETTPREPDELSDYREPRPGEHAVELAFVSVRNCPSGDIPACSARAVPLPHKVRVLYLGCTDPADVLLTWSPAEADGLLRNGDWSAGRCLEGGGDFTVHGPQDGSSTRVPLFRCVNQKFHSASLDPSCGDAETEGEIGYVDVGPSAVGSLPLRGCSQPGRWRPALGADCPAGWTATLLGYVSPSP